VAARGARAAVEDVGHRLSGPRLGRGECVDPGCFPPESGRSRLRQPFEARLLEDQWAINPVKSGDDLDTVKALRKQGMSIRDIADRTGLTRSTVQRRLGGDEDYE
jgi:hypothetical protein